MCAKTKGRMIEATRGRAADRPCGCADRWDRAAWRLRALGAGCDAVGPEEPNRPGLASHIHSPNPTPKTTSATSPHFSRAFHGNFLRAGFGSARAARGGVPVSPVACGCGCGGGAARGCGCGAARGCGSHCGCCGDCGCGATRGCAATAAAAVTGAAAAPRGAAVATVAAVPMAAESVALSATLVAAALAFAAPAPAGVARGDPAPLGRPLLRGKGLARLLGKDSLAEGAGGRACSWIAVQSSGGVMKGISGMGFGAKPDDARPPPGHRCAAASGRTSRLSRGP